MNVIFISMDTLRADRLSCLGYQRGLTPNLDRIASQGSLFTQAYASDIPTQPSHTAIFTGCYGVNTGVVSHYHPRTQLDESASWLPTVFQDKGYATGAVDHLFSMKGWFVRGYTDYMSPPGRSRSPGSVINDIGFRWLDDKKDEDIFLFLHFWDPHVPYVPPPAYRDMYTNESSTWTDPLLSQKLRSRPTYPLFTRNLYDHIGFMPNLEYISDLYDAEVAYLDFEIGRLFKKLDEVGIIDNTVVVLFGDHGENMTEHDAWFDHAGLYDSVVRVPLILWAPGLVPKARVSELVQLIDVKPTVLEIMGLPQVAGLDGQSLVPLMEGQTSTHRDAVYLSECTWQAKRGVRTSKWKYIRAMDPGVYPRSEDELYDLEADPDEQTNVAVAHPDVVSELDAQLSVWLDEQLRGRPDPMRQVVEDGLPAVVRLDGIIDAPEVKEGPTGVQEAPTGELPVVAPGTFLPETEPAIAVSQSNSLAEQSETALVPSTLPTAALMVPTAPPPDDEKRKVRRRRAALVTVAAILAVIALIFAITSILSSNVQAAGQLQPMQSVDLNFQSTAPIESVSVAPGQSVHKGEALATQSSTALTAQYAADVTKLKAAQVALATGPAPNQTPAQLQAAVAQAQAALTTAQTKASSEANLDGIAVANANSQITSAQSTLATDESSVTSACSPGPQGSTDGCDTAEHQLGVDQAALTSAQGALHLAQQTQSTDAANSQASIAQAQSALATAQADEAAGTQPQSQSQESTEQAAVNAAQAAVAADQKAIDATQIYAPFSGIVAAVNGTVGDLAGPTGIQQSSSPAGVSSGTSSGIQIFPQAPVNSNSKTPQQLSLITLNTRAMNVVVQIGESDISNIHVGEGATVTFPAQSGAVYQAKVSYIEPSAVNDNGKVYFLVHLVLVSSKGRPVPAPSRLSGLSGLTADVTFN